MAARSRMTENMKSAYESDLLTGDVMQQPWFSPNVSHPNFSLGGRFGQRAGLPASAASFRTPSALCLVSQLPC
jgi:hypothetical protein